MKKILNATLNNNNFINSRYISLVGVSVSFLMIYGVWFFSERYFFNQGQERFEHYADESQYTLKNNLRQYEHALRSGVGFFQASNDVTRADWYHFIESLDTKNYYPGMQGIGYTIMIPHDQIKMTEEKIRREGYPSFEVKPKGEREVYSAILYLEPLDKRNRAAIGYDMFSEPIRREAMERARDTGMPALSGKVTLVQEIDKEIQAGVLMYLPYYAEEEAPNSVEKRRKLLLGYVYAPFRMNDLMNAINTHNDVMRIEIYDGEGRREENLLYASPNISSYHSSHYAQRTLDIGGRTWHIYYSSSADFDARHSSLYPFLFAIIGLILYLMMMYVIVELLRKRLLLKVQTEALKHQKETAQNYLDIVDVMVLVLDTDYKIVMINRRGYEILGYSAQEAIGKNFLELFIPERLRPLLHEVANASLRYGKHEYYENPIITKSGEERLIAWRNRQLFDEEGIAVGILSSGEDITEMRRTQEQLEESEAFYRTIFGSIEEAIIILHDNRVVDCNDVALTLFDTAKELFIGQSIFDTAYEIECQDYSLHYHITVAYSGEPTAARCTLRLHKNPNIVKIVEFSFSRFGSDEENKLVMISRDITNKVEEEKLFTMHARQAQMGEMISMIAHQWRQPLAIINAITSQMRLKAMINDDSDTVFIENLIKIEQQSAHLSQTISDYRDFFRPDKPKERFNVVSLIDHALNLIDHTLKSHSIHIENSHLYNLMLYTYRNEVLQVLIVLLKNSLDAFVENKVQGGEIKISVQREGKYCVIAIRDNAGGIPQEVMHKLFSPYFTTKNDSLGTGLGLYMSRIIIQEHCDGLIDVTSVDTTTTFTVKLPYEEEQ